MKNYMGLDFEIVSRLGKIRMNNLKIIISQPFAAKILTNSIVNHFREGDPPKPLVLMLHGPTGVGKKSSKHDLK